MSEIEATTTQPGSPTLETSPPAEGNLAERLSTLRDASPRTTDSQGDTEPKEATLAPENRRAKRMLLNKDSLPKLGNGPSTITPSPPTWLTDGAAKAQSPIPSRASPASSLRSQTPAAKQKATVFLSLQVKDKGEQKKALAEITKSSPKVSADASQSGAYTTFLLKGPIEEVENARRVLSRHLAPRVSKTIHIPPMARSTLLGPKGSTLRAITNETFVDVKLDKNSASTTDIEGWSLPSLSVGISGPEPNVKEAQAKIFEIVSEGGHAGTVTAHRNEPIPENMLPFVLAQFKSYMKTDKDSQEMTAPFKDINSLIENAEKLIKQCSEYTTMELKDLPEQKVRCLSPTVLLESQGVLLVNNELYGPSNVLKDAHNALKEQINNLHVASLDLSKAHGGNKDHLRCLISYLEASDVNKLQKILNVSIARPDDGFVFYVNGEDKAKVEEAKRQLRAAVIVLPPSAIVALPVLNSPVALAHAKNALSKTGPDVQLVTLQDKTLLVYGENEAEDFAPSEKELSDRLNSAAALLEPALALQRENATERVRLSSLSDQKYIRDPVGTAKQHLSELIQLENGLPKVDITYTSNGVVLSGPKAAVSAAAAALPELVEESKMQHRLANYSEELQVDSKHTPNIIGRNGSNIQKFRTEHDVRVDIDSAGKFVVRGFEENVKRAIKALKALVAKLEDEVEVTVNVPQKYHAQLIGSGGKFVKRIKDKYNVRVQFQSSKFGDQLDSTDKDKIILSGPSKGVAATKREFQEFVAYEEAHSYSREIIVPSEVLRHVIGRHGAVVNRIKEESGTQIDVTKPDRDGSEDAVARITGEKAAVEKAAKEIEALIEEQSDYIEKVIDVDPKFHRLLIGTNSEIRKQIVSEAGGVTEPWNPRTFYVPPAGSTSRKVTLSGRSKVVEAMEKAVKNLLEKREAKERVSDTLRVPIGQYSVIIGSGGSTKREIEDKYNVIINVPRKADSDSVITIKGSDTESVGNAKAHILELVDSGHVSVKIPSTIEGDLSQAAWFLHNLEDKYDARVRSKNRVSPRSTPPSTEKPGEELQSKGWVFATEPYAPKEKGDRKSTWTVTGKSQEACEQAAKDLSAFVKEICARDTIGYLWLSRPNYVSAIIGPGGATVNSTREKTRCKIEVPKNAGKNGQAIVIVGSADAVDTARKELLVKAGFNLGS